MQDAVYAIPPTVADGNTPRKVAITAKGGVQNTV